MISTSADSEFRRKRSSVPLGMGEEGSNPPVIPFSNSRVFSVMHSPYESGFTFTFSDFKLRKKDSSSFQNWGTKERTYAITDGDELESVYAISLFEISYKQK